MDKRTRPSVHYHWRRLTAGHNSRWKLLAGAVALALLFWWLNHGSQTDTNVVQTGKKLANDNTLTFYEKMMLQYNRESGKSGDPHHRTTQKHVNDNDLDDNEKEEKLNRYAAGAGVGSAAGAEHYQDDGNEDEYEDGDEDDDSDVGGDVGGDNKSRNPSVLKSSTHSGSSGQQSIKSLLAQLFPVVESVEPSLGYMYRSEMEEMAKPKRSKFLKNLIPRVMGKNAAHNIASHDSVDHDSSLSKSYLESCLQVPEKLFETLKWSHAKFVESIPNSYQKGTYEGNGIVLIAGGKFSWLSLLGVENLRATGSKLPVEIIIPKREEYEPQLCEVILPKLNARCVLLYKLIPKNLKNNAKTKSLGGYQYKSLALLASSFENVLFLDSDNVPIKNPDTLFHSEPFKSHGMIFWPDFWRRVTHPKYYELTGKKIGSARVRYWSDTITPPELYLDDTLNPATDISLHDLASTVPDLSSESGQLIVNKKTHFKSLLLSFYYNVYGPRHYYPLFSQGAAGEGDKETFIAAAAFYDLPYYQVKKPVGVVGHRENESYHGVGMIQYDPIIDMENGIRYKVDLDRLIKEHKEHGDVFQYSFQNFLEYFSQDAEPMFFHCNFPKLDPISLIVDKKLMDDDETQWRLFEDQPNIGFDFELRQWELMDHYFCSEDFTLNMMYLQDSQISPSVLCSVIGSRIEFLKSNPIN